MADGSIYTWSFRKELPSSNIDNSKLWKIRSRWDPSRSKHQFLEDSKMPPSRYSTVDCMRFFFHNLIDLYTHLHYWPKVIFSILLVLLFCGLLSTCIRLIRCITLCLRKCCKCSRWVTCIAHQIWMYRTAVVVSYTHSDSSYITFKISGIISEYGRKTLIIIVR